MRRLKPHQTGKVFSCVDLTKLSSLVIPPNIDYLYYCGNTLKISPIDSFNYQLSKWTGWPGSKTWKMSRTLLSFLDDIPAVDNSLSLFPGVQTYPSSCYTVWILDMTMYSLQNNISQVIFTVGFPYLSIPPATEQRFRKKYYIWIISVFYMRDFESLLIILHSWWLRALSRYQETNIHGYVNLLYAYKLIQDI